MNRKNLIRVLKRLGLGVAVAGTSLYATNGCVIVDTLRQLVNRIVPGTST